MRRLFWEILRCEYLEPARVGTRDCTRVVQAQAGVGHLPEPWVGRISEAPLLFISSNPGFDPEEHFPTTDWRIREVELFFTERFSAGDPRYVRDFRVRLSRGGYAQRSPQYWNEAHACAAELLGRDPAGVTPGVDYALTEVVHCKSRNNEGTAEAARFCASKYLRRILATSGSRVVVCYGDVVSVATHELLGVPPGKLPDSRVAVCGPINVEGRSRTFLFLPQPGSNRARKPTSVLSADQLASIRGSLRSGSGRHGASTGTSPPPTQAEIDAAVQAMFTDGEPDGDE